MARFLRWLLGLDNVTEILEYGDDARALRRRIEPRLQDLADDVSHLELRFDRLRGQVTGALSRGRRPPDDDDVDLPESEADDEVAQEVLDMIQRRRNAQG